MKKFILLFMVFSMLFTPLSLFAKQKDKYIDVFTQENKKLEYNIKNYYNSKIKSVTIKNIESIKLIKKSDYKIQLKTKKKGISQVIIKLKNNAKIVLTVKVVSKVQDFFNTPINENYNEDLNKVIKATYIYNPIEKYFNVVFVKPSRVAYKNVNYTYSIYDDDGKIEDGTGMLDVIGEVTYAKIYSDLNEENIKDYKIKFTFNKEDNKKNWYQDVSYKINIKNVDVVHENRYAYISYEITNTYNKPLDTWIKYIYEGNVIDVKNNIPNIKNYIFMEDANFIELLPKQTVYIKQKIDFNKDNFSYDTIRVVPIGIETNDLIP